MAYNNLNEYYSANGGANTWNSTTRTADAKRAGITGYAGTADQNAQLLSFLSNPSATSPKSTYVASKAGTPTWQSDLSSVLGSSAKPNSSPYNPPGAPNQSTVNGPVYNPPPFQPYTAQPNMSTNQGPARGNPDGSITYNTSSGAYTSPAPTLPISTPYNRDTAGPSYIPPGTPVSSAPATPAETFVQNRVSGGANNLYINPAGDGSKRDISGNLTSSSDTGTGGGGGVGGGFGAGGGAPAMGPMGGAVSAADKAFEDYLKSLTEKSDSDKEDERLLAQMNSDANLANERALNSGETMGFAGGEAQRVGRNNDLRIAGQAARVGVNNAARANMTAAQKARLDYEQGRAKNASDLEQATYDRGQDAIKNAQDAIRYAPDPMDTKWKQAQIDNLYADNARLSAPASAKGTVRSGGLTYTAQDAEEDTQTLEASRNQGPEADGVYADPNVYSSLYKAWVDNGGLLKDFLAKFPPKLYVNPANTFLPPYLMPPKAAGGIVNPFA